MYCKKLDRDIPDDKLKQIVSFIDAHRNDYERTNAAADHYSWYEGESYVPSFVSVLKDGMNEAFQRITMHQTHFLQLLSFFDVFTPEEDPYISFLNRVEEIHGPLKGKTIVEVGGGPVPALARRMKERMLDENGEIVGSITVYDPDLIEGISGVDCRKQYFDMRTNVPSDALLIGMQPCEATMPMVTFIDAHHLQGTIKLCSCYDCQAKVKEFRGITEFRGEKKTSVFYRHAYNEYSGREEPILTTEGRSR